MTTTNAWTPKVGDPVKYTAQSTISGRVANVQIMKIEKVTKSGYFYIDRRRGEKFKRGLKQDRLYAHVGKGQHFTNFRCWIEPATAVEIETLPRSDGAGSQYAREHASELRD